MKVDLGLDVGDLARCGHAAADLEAAGVDGTFSFDGPHGPFLPLALAASRTRSLHLWSGIAVAFARSPMTVAQDAQDLQLMSAGRFTLGLGSQIRAHVERRFAMPWSHPAERMEEYVQAVRAIWHCWATGTPLAFEGRFYRHTLMTPFFDPGPNPHGDPAIALAAVGPRMLDVAGRRADALLVHPFHSRSYLDDVVRPRVTAAARACGRPDEVALWAQTIVALGRDREEVAAARTRAKGQLGFYGSTPAYRRVLEHHGLGDLQPRLRELTRAGRWRDLAAEVPRELVDEVVVSGAPGEVAAVLRDRNVGMARTALVPYDGTGNGSGVASLVAALR